jgi:hypothetical protein
VTYSVKATIGWAALEGENGPGAGRDEEQGPGGGRAGTGAGVCRAGTEAGPHWTRSKGLAAASNGRFSVLRECAAGEGVFGRSGGGAVSDDRMHGGRRVRARSSASASCSMARAAAELDVPLHGAHDGAPCISKKLHGERPAASVPGASRGRRDSLLDLLRLQTAGQLPTAQRSETRRFQFQILFSGRTCKVLKSVRILLQKQICTMATSLNSGRRE